MALPGLVKRWLRRLKPAAARFVFDPQYELSVSAAPVDPSRAQNILTFLASEGLVRRDDVRPPRPATLEALRRVHTDEYLEALAEPGALTSILGVEVSEAEQEQTLRLQRLMVGGTSKAVRLALSSGGVGVNLGGGFHHARAGRGAGFCVFNDIAVAIARRRDGGFTGNVLVVDLDIHDGDGTRSIFAADPTVHTLSIHCQHWDGDAAVESTCVALGEGVEDAAYLDAVAQHLPPLLERFKPGLVIYLAGADPAADDRLGNWRITSAGMLARDKLVWSLVRHRPQPIPLAVVLAGGYGRGAWRYSARFLHWALSGEDLEPPGWEDITLLRFRHLKELLDPRELSGEPSPDPNDLGLTEADLLGDLQPARRPERFMDFYTLHGIELVLERYGLLKQVHALGYRHPSPDVELSQGSKHLLRLYGNSERTELLLELLASRDRRTIPRMDLLSLEWLLLQNPRGQFNGARPQLPGQKHPGLGLLADVFGVLVMMCERLELDGIVFVPSHYHVAAQSVRHLRFLRPEHQANFTRIRRASAGMPLAEATRALAAGRLLDPATREPLQWIPGPMIYPTSEPLRRHMERGPTRPILEEG